MIRNGKKMPRWSASERETLLRMLRRGESWAQIASVVGRTEQATMQYFYQNAGRWRVQLKELRKT